MTEEEAVHLAREIAKALQQARSVSDSEHYDHHVWISGKIERDKEERLFWEDMRRHASKWGMVSVISGMFYAVWLGLQQIVHR